MLAVELNCIALVVLSKNTMSVNK